jgi:diacylglycerol kinase family enzyme
LREALESHGATVIETSCSKEPPVLAENVDHICIVGGDGTVRDILNAVTPNGREPEIAVYPMGTVNLLAREGRYSRDPGRFVRRLLSGEPGKSHYPASVGDGMFLVCATVGPDSAAVARLSPRLKRVIGRLAYVVAFAEVMFRWPRQPIRLTVDGRQLDCEAFYVAKGHYFAGPWSFAPEAGVDRPTLHLVAFARMRRLDALAFSLALLLRRPIDRLRGATCLSCTELSAESAVPLPVQADGDIVATLPAAFRLGEMVLQFR